MLPRLSLVFLVAFAVALPSVAHAADGCTALGTVGCGGCACQSCVCGMDDYCCTVEWDDLCADECAQCGGCGGSDPGGGCGNISYEGCCEGQTVKYCEGGSLQTLDCTANPSCGWNASAGYYDCGTVGGSDPGGGNPKSCNGTGPGFQCGNGVCESGESATTCPADCGATGGCGSISYEGCCDGQMVKFCEAGQLSTLDCTSQPACGWSDQGGFYDCGTPGMADPSGTHPMSCTGGVGPTQPTCGNKVCDNGETVSSCPADCGCQANCAGRQCGEDGCGGQCAPGCGPGFYCDLNGQCIDMNCTPKCEGKQCGPDTCGSQCGGCPAGMQCSADGQFVTAGEQPPDGQNDAWDPKLDGDVDCLPDCYGKLCGDDGCGATCGACPEGFGCNPEFMCVKGYVPPATPSPYQCEGGKTLLYGKCVMIGEEAVSRDTGCAAAPVPAPLATAVLLAGLWFLSLLRARRRS